MTTITLLTPGYAEGDETGRLGLLFECAPDSAIRKRYPHGIGLVELIGDLDEAKLQAFALTRKLLADEPEHRSIRQLGIFEEVIIRECLRIALVARLYRRLVSLGIKQCRFVGNSSFAEALARYSVLSGGDLRVDAPSAQVSPRFASLQRSWRRLCTDGFSGRAIKQEWQQVLDRLDPYRCRDALMPLKRQTPKGGLWFYTTAYTFTRIGQLYEPYFPSAFHYLVENPLTGGQALRESGRAFTRLSEFSTLEMAPSAHEVKQAQASIRQHLADVRLVEDEDVCRQLFLESAFFAQFQSRHLPRGLYSTALFEAWADKVKPDALIVGNPVFEGYALHTVQKRGIPTILLQHGILGDYCQFWDPPVDHHIVRGTFWQEFLAECPRTHSIVLNPPSLVNNNPSLTVPRDVLLFLTASYETEGFGEPEDLVDILRVLLAVAERQKVELVIRVHPLESIGAYRNQVERLVQTMSESVRVTYSQGPGLDELVRRSRVAVLYCSTVFLDCLHHHVPIVSFGWHDFSIKRQIQNYGVFHFANDLAELDRLITAGIRCDLSAYSNDVEPFLASTSASDLRNQLLSASYCGKI